MVRQVGRLNPGAPDEADNPEKEHSVQHFQGETNMTARSHRSDPRILDRRTLQRDHRHLAGLLRPGLSVLDIGCGTGAITAGIAEAVGPHGYVVGIDRDEGLLERARAKHGSLRNLRFEHGDATALSYRAQFDIVTAARTLQWISELDSALSRMKQAAKPGGMLVALDYNHAKNRWEPHPPPEFCDFYKAFLAWREARQWDNHMADHLPELFRSLGLADVESHVQDEIIERGGPEFAEHADLWSQVIENLGEQLAKAGFCMESQLQEARERYGSWAKTELMKQTLAMRTITGRAP